MADRTTRPSRRTLIRCAALCGVGLPALAACGSGEESTGAPDPGASAPGGTPSASASDGTQPGGDAQGLVAAADVPVGGGVILADAGVVVTQPSKGRFKGFSDKCTHQGATLTSVENGVITCPNHGSQFAIEDGANVTGPNGEPGGSVPALPAVTVQIRAGQVVRVDG